MKNIALAVCAAFMLLLFQAGSVQIQTAFGQTVKSPEKITKTITEERPPVKCLVDSPERRGEEGCAILANRPVLGTLTKPVYWHIDRFDSLEVAKKAAGPDGIAIEAHGSVWLMTVEARNKDHHGGRHVAWIGPLVIPAADHYSMRVQSSVLRPGTTTPVHTHSGSEVFYIVSGKLRWFN